ncbi:MAG TPA: Gfo/Idh/MocA family oxidoreductase [Polyangia bacterium]
MADRVRWGVLGAARIAVERVIPATKACPRAEVVAIASRSLDKARGVAERHGIPRVYGSYEELLADPDIDAVYNPLPNHLHVPWSIRAMEAGKHVLCEKPIALDAAEARTLIAARERTGKLVQEAAMVRTHPRWVGARALIRAGKLGALRAVTGFFSYHNTAPDNVRNKADLGGGGLLDVGFYPITISRFLFEAEPVRVIGMLERDPTFGVDRLASGLLEFPSGQATFTCATQLPHHQWADIHGTRARLGVEMPWSMPSDRPSRLLLDDGSSLTKDTVVSLPFEACDQWQVQCDRFCEAIQTGAAAPIPIEDAVATMEVIDAIFRSTRSGHWETPGRV